MLGDLYIALNDLPQAEAAYNWISTKLYPERRIVCQSGRGTFAASRGKKGF